MGKRAQWILSAHWVIRPQDIPAVAERLGVSEEELCEVLALYDVASQGKDT